MAEIRRLNENIVACFFSIGPTSLHRRHPWTIFALSSGLFGSSLVLWMRGVWSGGGEQVQGVFHFQAISLSDRFVLMRGVHFGFHGRERLQWLCDVCVDLRIFSRRLQLCHETLHLRESACSKLCSSLGICSMCHGDPTTFWGPPCR